MQWAVFILFAASTAHATNAFQAGAVCAGVSNGTEIPRFLEGTHFKLGAIHWPPFAVYNSTQAGNAAWSGFDMDLIALVAKTLKFTYTIHLVPGPVPPQTWTDVGINGANQHDIVLSYWLSTTERRAKITQLMGYMNADQVLIAPVPKLVQPSLGEQMFTFVEPFTIRLWILIIALCILSGVVLYAVEYNSKRSEDFTASSNHIQGATVSIYLAFASFTGIGGHTPVTRGGRVLSLALGFMFVIILAAYTANLAAFLTVAAKPVSSIGSIDDLVSSKKAVCISVDFQAKLRGAYPGLKTLEFTSYSQSLAAMLAGKCEATITEKVAYDTMKTKASNCGVTQVGQPVLRSSAGWLTNKKSWCVPDAVNYAMQSILESGTLQELYQQYFVPATCARAVVSDITSNKLDIPDLAGVFLIYTSIAVIVVTGRVIRNFRESQDKPFPAKEEFRNDVRASLSEQGNKLTQQAKTLEMILDLLGHASHEGAMKMGTSGISAMQPVGGKHVALSDQEALMRQLFTRYDLDQSGSINTNEELYQLCLNLVHRLGLKHGPDAVERLTCEAEFGTLHNENALDFDAFKSWFADNVMMTMQ